MSNKIKLRINSKNHSFRDINNINLREIRKKLLAKGYEEINIMGIPIKECSSGVNVFVELDADFIIESCQNLEDLISANEEFEHYSHLGDGSFFIEAFVGKKIAEVIYMYCPQARKDNMISNTEEIDRERYFWLWRNLAYDLIDIAEK